MANAHNGWDLAVMGAMAMDVKEMRDLVSWVR
jgi:hypothetical protein